MHSLNVQILGPSSFIATINELKSFLKFNPIPDKLSDKHTIILFHINALQDLAQKNIVKNSNLIKICAAHKKDLTYDYDGTLELPTTLREINTIVENTVIKRKYIKNSSIEIKNYFLDKNKKKLSKFENFIILTEKEVQLLELLLNKKKPISKKNILLSVWNYSSDADTHTVETHIYRLRKKIYDKFMDNKFILNNKDGYYL